jgi:hypothetical protein
VRSAGFLPSVWFRSRRCFNPPEWLLSLAHRHVPIRRHPRCRSGGFRFLVPDSPRLSAAARLAGFERIRDKPDTMDRDGREATKEAI